MNNPKLFPRPFCDTGLKNVIPVNRADASKPELATLEDGFPPITMTPKAAGGLPPHGRDINGILHDFSEHIVFLSKGGRYKFDDAFATAIGGYAKGTILQGDNDDTNEYISTIDNNTINFNTTPSAIGSQWIKYNNAVSEDDLKKLFVGYYDSVPAAKQLSEIIYVPANGLMYWNGTQYVSVNQYEKIGNIVVHASTTPPVGHLVCNGGAISRATYRDLFNVIGTKYGVGDGSTTFNVPNITDGDAILSGSLSTIGESTVGEGISHRHIFNTANWNYAGTTHGMPIPTDGGTFRNINTSFTGGSKNLAAGVKFLICIRYE